MLTTITLIFRRCHCVEVCHKSYKLVWAFSDVDSKTEGGGVSLNRVDDDDKVVLDMIVGGREKFQTYAENIVGSAEGQHRGRVGHRLDTSAVRRPLEAVVLRDCGDA